jgi:hypothetical protein
MDAIDKRESLLIIPPPSLLNICISKERNTMPVKKVFFILLCKKNESHSKREIALSRVSFHRNLSIQFLL